MESMLLTDSWTHVRESLNTILFFGGLDNILISVKSTENDISTQQYMNSSIESRANLQKLRYLKIVVWLNLVAHLDNQGQNEGAKWKIFHLSS